MFELETTPGRTCRILGKEFLFFSGYSYLGMNHVKEFNALIKEGIDRYGTLYPSSRISNTRLGLYLDFENNLSAYTAMDETVTFSSGYLAGKTIADILSEYKNVIIAPGTHPAILPNPGKHQTNTSFTGWLQNTIGYINASSDVEFVLVSDALNILTGEMHDLPSLQQIDPAKKCIALIDVSHSIGLRFQEGRDFRSNMPRCEHVEYIFCFSLSKALNIHAGAISCSKDLATRIRQHPAYTGSTPVDPSAVYAYLHATGLYDVQRQKLFDIITYLKEKLSNPSILTNDFHLPIFVCNKRNAEQHFYSHQIIISSFGYPDPSSDKIDRIVLNALHTRDDIDQLVAVL